MSVQRGGGDEEYRMPMFAWLDCREQAANDWKVPKAISFVEPLGAFDQLILGGNWTNLAIERYVWRDPEGMPAMPQILIVERTVTTGSRVSFSEPKVLRRVMGGKEIPAWVELGAPISAPSAPHP